MAKSVPWISSNELLPLSEPDSPLALLHEPDMADASVTKETAVGLPKVLES